MKILKAKYENGQVKLTEPAPEPGPVDVEVVFLDRDDRRWDEIIRDRGPRPALRAEADQVLEDYRAGKTAPLDPQKLCTAELTLASGTATVNFLLRFRKKPEKPIAFAVKTPLTRVCGLSGWPTILVSGRSV